MNCIHCRRLEELMPGFDQVDNMQTREVRSSNLLLEKIVLTTSFMVDVQHVARSGTDC